MTIIFVGGCAFVVAAVACLIAVYRRVRGPVTPLVVIDPDARAAALGGKVPR